MGPLALRFRVFGSASPIRTGAVFARVRIQPRSEFFPIHAPLVTMYPHSLSIEYVEDWLAHFDKMALADSEK